jgi:hypothetical protein
MWRWFERLVESHPLLVVVVAVLAAVAAVLAAGLREKTGRRGILTEWYRAFGHAVLLGLVVAVFLHFAAEKQFLQGLSKSVTAGAALRSLLSANLADLVEHHVIRDPFVYETFEHQMRIDPAANSGEVSPNACLRFRSTIELTVKNVGAEESAFLWKFIASDPASTCAVSATLERLEVRPARSNRWELVKPRASAVSRPEANEGSTLSSANANELPPAWEYEIVIPARGTVGVRYDFVGEVRANDHAVQFFLHPVEDARLQVYLPDGLDGGGTAWHPAAGNGEWCDIQRDEKAPLQYVHVKKGSLPFNAVEVRWWPTRLAVQR